MELTTPDAKLRNIMPVDELSSVEYNNNKNNNNNNNNNNTYSMVQSPS
jgi:hypothetical protein